jgi:hypothetical protein
MPVRKCDDNKWRIGDGRCMYKTRKSAMKAYVVYLAQHPSEAFAKLKEMEEDSKEHSCINCGHVFNNQSLRDQHEHECESPRIGS